MIPAVVQLVCTYLSPRSHLSIRPQQSFLLSSTRRVALFSSQPVLYHTRILYHPGRPLIVLLTTHGLLSKAPVVRRENRQALWLRRRVQGV